MVLVTFGPAIYAFFRSRCEVIVGKIALRLRYVVYVRLSGERLNPCLGLLQ